MKSLKYKVTYNQKIDLKETLEDYKPSKIAVLVDHHTAEWCLPIIYEECPFEFSIITIPPGENYKNLETAVFIWNEMTRSGLDRQSILINVGGGVITDIGAFCAANYMRGIGHINIPTTLLGMVDAAIGGKAGVDFNGYKNRIGCFTNPLAVLIDTRFLTTLPFRQINSGFAEVMKYALIADEKLWKDIRKADNFHDLDLLKVIKRSVKIKADYVAGDLHDKGQRKVLNYGHTIGHALESYHLDQGTSFLHGESVAVGMVCAAFISMERGYLTEKKFREISDVVRSHCGNKSKSIPKADDLLPYVLGDKKNTHGMIKMVLLEDIGKAKHDFTVEYKEIVRALHAYKNMTS